MIISEIENGKKKLFPKDCPEVQVSLRPFSKKCLFPVQQVYRLTASRAARLFFSVYRIDKENTNKERKNVHNVKQKNVLKTLLGRWTGSNIIFKCGLIKEK